MAEKSVMKCYIRNCLKNLLKNPYFKLKTQISNATDISNDDFLSIRSVVVGSFCSGAPMC